MPALSREPNLHPPIISKTGEWVATYKEVLQVFNKKNNRQKLIFQTNLKRKYKTIAIEKFDFNNGHWTDDEKLLVIPINIVGAASSRYLMVNPLKRKVDVVN